MYERMLDKSIEPTFDDMTRYVGECGKLWLEFRRRISEIRPVHITIRFPYGSKYGWSARYGTNDKAGKHICDAFAESNAFTVHFRINNAQLSKIYDDLSEYSKSVCDNKYPCGDGGWLSYRVVTDDNLNDVLKILSEKLVRRA